MRFQIDAGQMGLSANHRPSSGEKFAKNVSENPLLEQNSPTEKKIWKNWGKLKRKDSKIYLETTMTIYFNSYIFDEHLSKV